MSRTTRYIAFLRAINVAGHGRVKMDVLRQAFEAAGCQNVRTWIQSGNVIFDQPRAEIGGVIERTRQTLGPLMGEQPIIMVRTLRELRGVISQDPFAEYPAHPDTKLYVTFLAARPARAPRFPFGLPSEKLTAIAMRGRDVFVVSGRKTNGFFGFPNDFVESKLEVSATSRNWSTVSRVAALAGDSVS